MNVVPPWHLAQVRLVCAPVRANPVEVWLNVAGVQARVEWQVAQFDPNADVCEAGLAWHDAHAVGVPAKVPGVVWHF